MSNRHTRKRHNARKPAAGPVITRGRLVSMLVVMSALAVALIWHLAYLQVIPNADRGFAFLQQQGAARTLRSEPIRAYRGVISDRNGEILAVSTPVKSLWANPQRLDMTRLPELADALGVSQQELGSKIARYGDKQFVYLQRNLPPQEADRVIALNIAGVAAEEDFQRYYPAGEVASHLVGFTNIDEQGQEGLELALNDWLSGAPGVRQVIKDQKGNVVKDLGVTRAASSGNDVQLSIDLRLQYLAYRELKNSIAEQGAASGSIVMMDVATGEVLAMVNQPSYNPNNREQIRPEQLRNRALTDEFEPGSTMKPFTVLAALESGRYTPETEINTSPGYWRVSGKTYSDFRDYGTIDLTTIITKSSQVGISKLALDLPPDDIRNTFYRFGFGQASGTGFPGEALGKLPSRNKWHATEHAALAFGHGLTVTALQLAQGYTAIAAGGMLRPASILKQVEIPQGQRAMSAVHAQQIMNILKTVTKKGGTATRAQIAAYPSAGKTGTAHKVGAQGYEDDKYVALFAGMAPADDPRIVTVVIIHEPPVEHYYGGEAAAPVFARVAEGALRLLQVPPNQSEMAAR